MCVIYGECGDMCREMCVRYGECGDMFREICVKNSECGDICREMCQTWRMSETNVKTTAPFLVCLQVPPFLREVILSDLALLTQKDYLTTKQECQVSF